MRILTLLSIVALMSAAAVRENPAWAAEKDGSTVQPVGDSKGKPAVRRRRAFKDARESVPVAETAKTAATKKSTIDLKSEPAEQPAATLGSSVMSWLSRMKERIAASQARSSQVVSVAAVRGDETPDAPPLYWKGPENEAPVESSEVEAFDAAISAALGGDAAGAVSRLETFLSEYPKSGLAGDARETLNRLRAP